MNIDKLIEEICMKYKVGTRNIFSQSRKKDTVTARKILYKVLLLYGKSSTQIGKIMNRDHSSIVVGAKDVDNKPELKQYATYLYLKYRDTEEISPRIDVKVAKKVIYDEVRYYLNEGLSPMEISLKIDLSQKIVESVVEKVQKDCLIRKVPNYKTGTYRNIYI